MGASGAPKDAVEPRERPHITLGMADGNPPPGKPGYTHLSRKIPCQGGEFSACSAPVAPRIFRGAVIRTNTVRHKMRTSHDEPHLTDQDCPSSLQHRARCSLRWSVFTTVLFASIGLVIGFPALLQANRAVDNLADLPSATDSMEAVLPWVLAMLLGAIVGLVFVQRARRHLRTIQEAEHDVGLKGLQP